jgi:hypothetical protein
LAGIRDSAEQVGCDKGLARASGEGQEGAWWAAAADVAGHLLKDGADGGVLVVSADAFTAFVRPEQGPGRGGVEREPHRGLVAGAEVGGRREVGHRARLGRTPGEPIELDEQVTVGGEDERNVEAPGLGVALGLIQTLPRRECVLLDLDDGDGDGLHPGRHEDAERQIGAALGPTTSLARDDVHRAGSLLALDVVLGPPSGVDRGVDQLRVGISLGERHTPLNHAWMRARGREDPDSRWIQREDARPRGGPTAVRLFGGPAAACAHARAHPVAGAMLECGAIL